ncbi:MAG: hypothetical protein AAFZ15_27185 [Bacteroidota bacterium]
MKKLFIAFLISTFYIAFLNAHPGIGIVSDDAGNIFYTDLNHVWKVTPDGNKSIYIPNVHTHELYIDQDNYLYGENSWYEGEATDKWGFTVWKKKNGQPLEFVIDTTEGFLFEHPFSFVRDDLGQMYWDENNNENYVFYKKIKDGETKKIATGTFENIRWRYWLNGHLHFIDLDDLYKIENSEIILIAKDLKSTALPFSTFVRDMHSIMGAWDDKNGNTYVAVYSGKMVKKISPSGKVSDYFKSKGNWSPSGGFFDDAGNLWLLEYSSGNEARVRKIDANKLTKTPVKMEATFDKEMAVMIGLIVFLVIGLLFLRGKSPRKRK